jgi:BCD family chlorophyll transporter-like MFS transporter
MTALALGGIGAAAATALMTVHMVLGLVLATLSFMAIGGGVSAAGTSLLVLLAKRVAPERKAAAATMVWMMMIAGFAVTAIFSGKMLDPFSPTRLVTVAAVVSGLALAIVWTAMWKLEGDAVVAEVQAEAKPAFRAALREVWQEPDARRFTVFIFVAMLAYSAQDLILEPFAGAFFRFTPGESTKLSGTQHAGVFAGMLLVAVVTTLFKGTPLASLKGWVIGGCGGSGLAMSGLVVAGLLGAPWPLKQNVFLLGLANGVFSIAAIGGMMTLAGQGKRAREGTRMGLWGAAQAIAFGAGGFLGTVLVDAAKWALGDPSSGAAYAFVFGLEVVGFFVAQAVALSISFGKVDLPLPDGAEQA